MAINFGNVVRDISKVDLTPGFQLNTDIHNGIPFVGHDDAALQQQAAQVAAAAKPKVTAPQAATQPSQIPDTSASGTYAGGVGSDAANAAIAAATLGNQSSDLNSLLGRTQTGLDQGLSALNDSYQSNVNQQGNQEAQAIQDFGDQRVQTNKDKLGAYDTIAKNANNGYRSLAQIIGRSAGTGSSAFQDLLPDVVGKDTSSKRTDANTTYAENLGNIDTAQKKTENSFAQVLQDLANQRASQEQQLRTGVEGQRQTLQSQIAQVEAQKAQAAGGNAAAIAASQAGPQAAIENSRNAVESFFNSFKPTVTAQQAAVAAPDLSQYTVDRSNINAADAGAADPTNPYADILRKKLQDQAV
jgi:hypothetical protein